MQQFDVVENLNSVTRSRFPFVVVLQHDLIAGLPYILVGPLADARAVKPLDHLRQ